MKITSYTVNPFAENSYLLINEGEALLVDPGFGNESEWEPAAQELEEQKAELAGIILTHAHIDHILGIPMLRSLFGAGLPVWLHPDDSFFWENAAVQAAMFGVEIGELGDKPKPVMPASNWQAGHFSFEIRHTPGHAPGHVVFYLKESGILLGGDTLFRESIGRTDLYAGNFEQLERSIRTQLYTLPDDTRVLPGHGPETTISYEKRHNPFVRGE